MITTNSFPFLDMELYWSKEGELRFKVYKKDGLKIKYVEKGSAHTPATIAAIPNGVIKRLARLTSKIEENKNKTIDELYPEHSKVLKNAKLIDKFPKFKEIWENEDDIKNNNIKKIKNNKKNRQLYFTIKVSKFWKNPIHKIIKRLRNKYQLKWLRFAMCYKRHVNLAEKFNADLTTKLNEDLISLDLTNNPCNCHSTCKINGRCAYGEKCRSKCIVYESKCKICDYSYIGNTQQNFKARMNQHFCDVQNFITKNKKSDSFAKHFAKHFNEKPTNQQMREIISFKVLWNGNPLSLNKRFGKSDCSLCMAERLKILDYSRNWKTRNKLINFCSEIYGAC